MTSAPGSSDSSAPAQRSSGGTGSTALDSQAARNRVPRSLPPWIDSYEVRYGTPTDDQMHLLNKPPKSVKPQHNNAPAPLQRRVSKDGYEDWDPEALGDDSKNKKGTLSLSRRRRNRPGRKWDHLRSAEPVIVPGYISSEVDSPWRTFVQSSRYGHMPNEDHEIVDPEVLDKLQPGFNEPFDLPSHHALEHRATQPTRTQAFYKRVWRIVLRHPFVPLTFRLIVLITSTLSLAISARIFDVDNDKDDTGNSVSQAIVAIVVDCVAVPYVFYMTWDEYTGRPLGLRSATQKISLTLMDLFFIIFKAASTTLAFEALVYHNQGPPPTSKLMKALATFSLIGLVAWSMNLTVSIFRLVQRLGGGEDENLHK